MQNLLEGIFLNTLDLALLLLLLLQVVRCLSKKASLTLTSLIQLYQVFLIIMQQHLCRMVTLFLLLQKFVMVVQLKSRATIFLLLQKVELLHVCRPLFLAYMIQPVCVTHLPMVKKQVLSRHSIRWWLMALLALEGNPLYCLQKQSTQLQQKISLHLS